MSSERLSRGVRKHNRREKASAVNEGRAPSLIGRSPSGRESVQGRNVGSEVRRQPSPYELINAGVTLFNMRNKFIFEKKPESLTDAQGVDVLNELANGIRSGQISTQEEVARQIHDLGSLIGPSGGVSIAINIAAHKTLQAIKSNKRFK